MTTQYTHYLVCFANGPISVGISAVSDESAIALSGDMDLHAPIDAARTDAEDDLDISGADMDESEFAAALRAAGCAHVRDLEPVQTSSPMPTSVAGGWVLWRAPATEIAE